jgi:hypothetical protein
VLTLAGLWGGVLFPHFSALAERSRAELREQLGFFASLSVVASLALLAGAAIVGPDLVPELFGAQFEPAGTPFVILMGAAALVLFTVSYGTRPSRRATSATTRTRSRSGAALNVATNLVLIPPFGMEGAASATRRAPRSSSSPTCRAARPAARAGSLDRDRVLRALAATAAMTAVLLVVPGDVAPSVQVGVGARSSRRGARAARRRRGRAAPSGGARMSWRFLVDHGVEPGARCARQLERARTPCRTRSCSRRRSSCRTARSTLARSRCRGSSTRSRPSPRHGSGCSPVRAVRPGAILVRGDAHAVLAARGPAAVLAATSALLAGGRGHLVPAAVAVRTAPAPQEPLFARLALLRASHWTREERLMQLFTLAGGARRRAARAPR